ncbi:hypothetical protein SDRG_09947 [Saprolegnia diclina VS20]|uniref:Uncharacterized protein n=1 Tax=Saprolegnia diclina (strain VS20) TaxID=1156394 RepID=T0QF17_SAPDV|nr:hypothetical protein SDRG_09947 [Saprolegnia diclina VS20]EQC32195.1 hypothetical protein SDRG_09947 [Saprolegnia diclina VS20]|eukprot:XP_008614136.1 hypothetical protein SDRG_09947 [Saprolegnia diclina VS20]
MRSLYLVLVAAFVAATHSACPDGQWEVSLLNSGTVYCVGGEPCSGRYTPGQSFGKYFCPQEGQPNVDGTTTLQMQTCCGVMNGNIMGCQRKTDNVQCVGPLPAPYKTPAPTTTTDKTTAPVTTTPTTTTLSPNATTLSPDATTLSPNATTLSPNATTLSPNATTLSPDATTLTPGATTLKPTANPNNIATMNPGGDNTDSSSSGLETKWIVLIAIGAVVLLALIGGLFLFRKKRESPSYLESPAGEEMLTPGPGSAGGGALTPRHNVTLL